MCLEEDASSVHKVNSKGRTSIWLRLFSLAWERCWARCGITRGHFPENWDFQSTLQKKKKKSSKQIAWHKHVTLPLGAGSCRCQSSLRWVVSCWWIPKDPRNPPSSAQKPGTREGVRTRRMQTYWRVVKIKVVWIVMWRETRRLVFNSARSLVNIFVLWNFLGVHYCPYTLQALKSHRSIPVAAGYHYLAWDSKEREREHRSIKENLCFTLSTHNGPGQTRVFTTTPLPGTKGWVSPKHHRSSLEATLWWSILRWSNGRSQIQNKAAKHWAQTQWIWCLPWHTANCAS